VLVGIGLILLIVPITAAVTARKRTETTITGATPAATA